MQLLATQASAGSPGPELGWPFEAVPNQSKGVTCVHPCADQSWTPVCPGEGASSWARQLPLAEGNSEGGTIDQQHHQQLVLSGSSGWVTSASTIAHPLFCRAPLAPYSKFA